MPIGDVPRQPCRVPDELKVPAGGSFWIHHSISSLGVDSWNRILHLTVLYLNRLTHTCSQRNNSATPPPPAAAMANVNQSQAFYALTLEQPSAPAAAVLCNAIPGLKAGDQQIFEARGQHVLLHRIVQSADGGDRKVVTVCDQDVFGIVRGVAAFRIPGTSTGQ